MSTRLLVVLLDLYAIGAFATWWRTLRVMPKANHVGEDVADILIVVLWPLMWAIAIVRLVALLVFTKEEV